MRNYVSMYNMDELPQPNWEIVLAYAVKACEDGRSHEWNPAVEASNATAVLLAGNYLPDGHAEADRSYLALLNAYWPDEGQWLIGRLKGMTPSDGLYLEYLGRLFCNICSPYLLESIVRYGATPREAQQWSTDYFAEQDNRWKALSLEEKDRIISEWDEEEEWAQKSLDSQF